MRYPIYIHKTGTGTCSGFVPDIQGCLFAGDTFDETIEDAAGAIDAHVEFTVDEWGRIPVARTFDAYLDDPDCQGGTWAYVDVDLSRYDSRSVKPNITCSTSKREQGDELSKKCLTVSMFSASAENILTVSHLSCFSIPCAP